MHSNFLLHTGAIYPLLLFLFIVSLSAIFNSSTFCRFSDLQSSVATVEGSEMENGCKPSMMMDGVATCNNNKMMKKAKSYDTVLRVVCLVLTLAAAIVVGTDEETRIATVTVLASLPPVEVPVTAKWQYMPAFVYLLVANVIACAYAAGSLLYSMAAGRLMMKNKCNAAANTTVVVIMLDVVIMGVLLSANGAAGAIGAIAYKGNSHAQWHKVCNMVSGFCHQLSAAVALSLLACILLLWLVALGVTNLHKKSLS